MSIEARGLLSATFIDDHDDDAILVHHSQRLP